MKWMGLNEEQEAAVLHRGGHALVVAGAGTGKTSTLVGRAAHLIETGTDPRRIALLTFTRRAAHEMEERLAKKVGAEVAGKVSVGTFHRLCREWAMSEKGAFGLGDTAIIDQDGAISVMRMARGAVLTPLVARCEAALEGQMSLGSDRQSKEAVEEQLRAFKAIPDAEDLVKAFSYSRNKGTAFIVYAKDANMCSDEALPHLDAIVDRFTSLKADHGYVDYDDVLYTVMQGMSSNEALRQRIAGRYDHILVDELQDNNPLQFRILEQFQEHAQLFCVGDDCQAIYSFRGADIDNIRKFTQRLPNATVYKLTLNYRSTQGILDAANWLLRESPIVYDKDLRAVRGIGPAPMFMEFETDGDEASWIVNDIRQRKAAGTRLDEMMVIVRSMTAARSIEVELNANQVPYKVIGGMSVLQAKHVKDVLSAVRAGMNHLDVLAWTRFLGIKGTGVGDVGCTEITTMLGASSEWEKARAGVLERYARRYPRLQMLFGIVDQLRALQASVPDVVATAVRLMEPILKPNYEGEWEKRSKDFDVLRKLGARYRSISRFLEDYTLEGVTNTEATDGDVLQVITVHSAKGTEKKVTYLPQANPGQYPHTRSQGNEADEEEERRVLFVALTRAKDTMIISRTRRIAPWMRSDDQPGETYFFNDVPDGLFEVLEPVYA